MRDINLSRDVIAPGRNQAAYHSIIDRAREPTLPLGRAAPSVRTRAHARVAGSPARALLGAESWPNCSLSVRPTDEHLYGDSTLYLQARTQSDRA